MTIFEAVQKGDNIVVRSFLKYGGDVNSTIITGSTLVMIAATYGRVETVEILIKAGADVNTVNYDGMTALMWCMMPMSNTGVVKLLINAGADVNASFSRSISAGSTALMLAAQSGRTEMVKLLIEAGADIPAKDNEGKTALDRAEEFRQIEVIKILSKTPQE